MNERFLVMGASGTVGSRVLALLRQAGHEAWGAARRPLTEPAAGPHASRCVRLDLLDPATHAAALRGMSTVMLISRPGDEEAHIHAEPFVAAMRSAGVRRVVALSALGAGQRPEFSIRKVEVLVERSGLAWAHVRPNFFMQMLALPPLSTELAQRGSLSLPLADAKVAYVDAQDVAAVLCQALTDHRLTGQALDVCGPEALDHHQIVARIAQCTGRAARYVALDEASAAALLAARGFAPAQLERVMAFYRLIRQGWCAQIDERAAHLIGRPLMRWEHFAASHAKVWMPSEEHQ